MCYHYTKGPNNNFDFILWSEQRVAVETNRPKKLEIQKIAQVSRELIPAIENEILSDPGEILPETNDDLHRAVLVRHINPFEKRKECPFLETREGATRTDKLVLGGDLNGSEVKNYEPEVLNSGFPLARTDDLLYKTCQSFIFCRPLYLPVPKEFMVSYGPSFGNKSRMYRNNSSPYGSRFSSIMSPRFYEVRRKL